MICASCGYDEKTGKTDKDKFVGMFVNGATISTSNGEVCGLFGCPKCHTVYFTTESAYIGRRKIEYKQKNMRNYAPLLYQ